MFAEVADEDTADRPVDDPVPIVVGVGASAGGLEALERLFQALPAKTGLAYVVVQHLSPDFESHMQQLLERATGKTVVAVSEGLPVRPDVIHLIPPAKQMICLGGCLMLKDREASAGAPELIDEFFRSIADEYGERSVGVVLSGTGSDGVRGLRAIHSAGGLTLVQEPYSARFGGMPQAAIDAGVADVIGTPEQLARRLEQRARSKQHGEPRAGSAQTGTAAAPPENGTGGHSGDPGAPTDAPSEPPALMTQRAEVAVDPDPEHPTAPTSAAGEEAADATRLAAILDLLHREAGMDFSGYKQSTVLRRLDRRLQVTDTADDDAYLELLQRDPLEASRLFDELLIGVTRFFRDPEAFECLRSEVLPELLKQATPERPLRIWVAGCSTGEEVYSVAMLLEEALDDLQEPAPYKIFATDLHLPSLQAAAAGVYQKNQLAGVSPERLERHFQREGSDYRVNRHLRRQIVFSQHNLLKQPPFTQVGLIVCRNLLIYLKPEMQRRAFSLFHFALQRQGYLMLGPSETLGSQAEIFHEVHASWKIFRKKQDARLPVGSRPRDLDRLPTLPTIGGARASAGLQRPGLSQALERMLETQLPPTVLITRDFEICHMFGGVERLLSVRAGRFSNRFQEMLDPSIRASVGSVLHHALRVQRTVRYSGFKIPSSVSGQTQTYTIVIEPLSLEPDEPGQFLVVRFDEASGGNVRGDEPEVRGQIDVSAAAREHIDTLERRLATSEENLQAVVEELEASNEELQATNEELVASNEELQSTNEELHSVNEELHSVNAEYQKKIGELVAAHDDMDNLLESTRVGVLFLDGQLNIRRFTPAIAELLSLMPSDIGRPISSFAHILRNHNLAEEARKVLSHHEPIECEVTDNNMVPYLMRVVPYQASDQESAVAGAVVQLVEIRSLRRTEKALRRFKFIADHGVDPQAIVDRTGSLHYTNHAMQEALGQAGEDLAGRNLASFIIGVGFRKLRDYFDEAFAGKRRRFQAMLEHPERPPMDIEASLSPVTFGEEELLLFSTRDIRERLGIERRLALEASLSKAAVEASTTDRAAEEFLAALTDGLGFIGAEFWAVERAGDIDWVGHLSETLNGRSHTRAADQDYLRLVTTRFTPAATAEGLSLTEHQEQARLERGESLAGRAWMTGLVTTGQVDGLAGPAAAPPDAGRISNNDPAEHEARSDNAFAMPVLIQDRCIGVIVLYTPVSPGSSSVVVEGVTVALEAAGRSIGECFRRLAVEESLRLRDRAVNSAGNGILIADARRADLPIIYANRGFELITGYHANEVIGRNCRFLQGDDADPEALRRIRDALRQQRACRETLRNYRKDGRMFWNDLTITPVHDAEGRLTHYVGIEIDVTERVTAEQQLEHASLAARAANQAKSEFLANMSHEIRTPISAILGYTDMLARATDDPETHQTVEAVQRNGRYLLELINDILDLSKIEAGKLDLRIESISVPELLTDLQELIGFRAVQKGLRFDIKPVGLIPRTIRTDRVRVRQILLNLISNAIKFTERGQVTVTTQLVETTGTEPRLRFTVEDTGIGISPSRLSEIFDAFSRVHNEHPELRDRFDGTGLGLNITKRLLDAISGEIGVQSELGRGSRFTVTLPTGSLVDVPMHKPDTLMASSGDDDLARGGTAERSGSGRAEVELAGRRILVVDDRRDIRKIVSYYLSEVGIQVHEAGNGQIAVDAVLKAQERGSPFDLIFMDMQMPVKGGHEATRELRGEGIQTPVIALTAGAMLEEEQRCIEAGCNAFLAKPVDADRLLDTVRQALDRDSAGTENC